jgi:hypothetical protein
MKKIKLPVLGKNDKRPFFPADGLCPVCQTKFKGLDGIAYLCAGSILDSLKHKIDDNEFDAFFNIGYHGKDSAVRDSANADIVNELKSDQFDLSFCSLGCIRSFLNQVIDDLEEELEQNIATMEEEDNSKA